MRSLEVAAMRSILLGGLHLSMLVCFNMDPGDIADYCSDDCKLAAF